MKNKTFKKINIKIEISIQQCTPIRNFSHFVELRIMEQSMPKNI